MLAAIDANPIHFGYQYATPSGFYGAGMKNTVVQSERFGGNFAYSVNSQQYHPVMATYSNYPSVAGAFYYPFGFYGSYPMLGAVHNQQYPFAPAAAAAINSPVVDDDNDAIIVEPWKLAVISSNNPLEF